MKKEDRRLAEVKARIRREQESRTSRRIRQLKREEELNEQESDEIRIQHLVDLRLQHQKQVCVRCVCWACLFVVCVVICSIVLVAYVQVQRRPQVHHVNLSPAPFASAYTSFIEPNPHPNLRLYLHCRVSRPMSGKDAHWEAMLLKEKERLQADQNSELVATSSIFVGSESEDDVPIVATLPKQNKRKQKQQRWVYEPVIPEKEVVSQYWDTLPAAMRASRDAANTKLKSCGLEGVDAEDHAEEGSCEMLYNSRQKQGEYSFAYHLSGFYPSIQAVPTRLMKLR